MRLSYMGPWAPMLATVPDWWRSKCTGAVCTPYRRVPPGFALGSAALSWKLPCAWAIGNAWGRCAATARPPLAMPRRFRNILRSTRIIAASWKVTLAAAQYTTPRRRASGRALAPFACAPALEPYCAVDDERARYREGSREKRMRAASPATLGWWHGAGLVVLLLAVLAGAGCASSVALQAPRAGMEVSCVRPAAQRDVLVGVALSGGGSRAALFGASGLEALARLHAPGGGSVLERVNYMSSVS